MPGRGAGEEPQTMGNDLKALFLKLGVANPLFSPILAEGDLEAGFWRPMAILGSGAISCDHGAENAVQGH